MVFIVGEAGIGKSRLLHELRRDLGASTDWLEGHCLSFGRSMALHPLVDLLRRSFGIDEADDEGAIAEKIDRGVARVGENPSTVPYLRALLSVDPGDPIIREMSPQERRGETFDALRRLIARAAERSPQVLVIEDLHWTDAATEQFLAAIRRQRAGVAGVVSLHLPSGVRSPVRRTELPLADRPGRVIERRKRPHRGHAYSPPMPCRTSWSASWRSRPRVIRSTSRSWSRSLSEAGALRRAGARYDLTRPLARDRDTGNDHRHHRRANRSAPGGPKRTLQLASVIGREFTRRLVHRLSEFPDRTDRLLRELKAIELIHERRRLARADLRVQARADPGRRLRLAAGPSASRACTGSSDRRSRSSTPIVSPSTTRCWPTTSPGPRSGSGRSSIS